MIDIVLIEVVLIFLYIGESTLKVSHHSDISHNQVKYVSLII